MKSLRYPLLLSAVTLALTGCSDNEAEQPVAAISVDKTEYEINESMNLRFVGSANDVVVFPGDEDHDYELRAESNTGLVVNKNLFTYSYSRPGVYHVVCVASNNDDFGRSLRSDTTSVWIRVIDDNTAITSISDPSVLYDEVFAKAVSDTDWLLALPRKVRYRNADRNINIERQKLNIEGASSSMTIELKDLDDDAAQYAAYNSRANYNLRKNFAIRTQSSSGLSRDYRLYTLNYGEFKTFAAAGVKGTIVRTEYDYSYYTIDIDAAGGTDLSAVPVTFTLYDSATEKVYVGEREVHSGDVFDFTDPVTFRFVVSEPGNEAIKLESTCVVTVR